MTNLSRSTLEADLIRHRQSGDFAAQAEMLFTLAEIAYEDQEYSLAQGLYAQAYTNYEHTNHKHGMAKAALGLGYALNSLFWNYTNLTSIPAEFSPTDINLFYNLALGLYIELDDKRGQAEAYTAMGHEAFDTTEVERAQTNYKLALECYESLEDIQGQADTLQNMGQRYDDSDPNCRLVYERALKLYQKLGDQRNEAFCMNYLGRIADKEHDYKTARRNLEYAYAIFLSLGDAEYIEITYQGVEDIRDKTEPERIYSKDCERTSAFLCARDVPQEMITLWEDFVKIDDEDAVRLNL